MKLPRKVYLIDTNVILRYLLGDHAKLSPKAEAFMIEVSKGTKKAEILDVVIAECIYVMNKFYNIPRKEIVEKLSGILNFAGIVNSGKSKIIEALLKYRDLNIDIVDCILAANSSNSRVVISFDNDMKKLKAFNETL
ncbi:MAG: PIN domain-containing protein [Deltaproteobacteria bacterium]|jgi:predicted nucleic-acid-binding protein|nr:PIN domain-containing protein [Deltaproteobacteria bacterium]